MHWISRARDSILTRLFLLQVNLEIMVDQEMTAHLAILGPVERKVFQALLEYLGKLVSQGHLYLDILQACLTPCLYQFLSMVKYPEHCATIYRNKLMVSIEDSLTYLDAIFRSLNAHCAFFFSVPNVPHDWLGWYETGKSSYLTFDKWLYFSSRFQCPCSVPIPAGPTPSPGELLRLL
jgi:hypothetical protein